MRKVIIYGLFDPRRPDIVMTVGKTILTLEHRRARYLKDLRRKHGVGKKTREWIQSMLAVGVIPGIRKLAVGKLANWRMLERRFISIWRKKNPKLTNILSGGNGTETKTRKRFCDKCGTKRAILPGDATARCPRCRKLAHSEYLRRAVRSQKRQGLCRTYGCSQHPEPQRTLCKKHLKYQRNASQAFRDKG